jgi:CRISPR system Cascade subunit CasB
MQNSMAAVQNSVDRVIQLLTTAGQEKRAGKFTAWGTAMLARLRRAAGTLPAENAEVWEVTIGALRGEWAGQDREKAELAVHTALTLFGLHQQGSYQSVNVPGVGFGKAVKRIIDPNKANEAGTRRRFNALATASEFAELAYHARGLVQLIRAKGAGFDYPKFAVELYQYQLNPEQRNRVRMHWARDFYASGEAEQKQAIENK